MTYRTRIFKVVRQLDDLGAERFFVYAKVTHVKGRKVELDWRSLMEHDLFSSSQVQVHRPNYAQALRAIVTARLADEEFPMDGHKGSIVYDESIQKP
jgi:hypothetical protein